MATAARLHSAAVGSLAGSLEGLDLRSHPPGALQGLCLLLPSLVEAARQLVGLRADPMEKHLSSGLRKERVLWA